LADGRVSVIFHVPYFAAEKALALHRPNDRQVVFSVEDFADQETR
jgi:hypothetical protein